MARERGGVACKGGNTLSGVALVESWLVNWLAGGLVCGLVGGPAYVVVLCFGDVLLVMWWAGWLVGWWLA